MDIAEILGLTASILVLVSFVMKENRVIRIINIIGAVFFVVYGLMISAWSIWLLNSILILVHLYFLIFKSKNTKKNRASTRLRYFKNDTFNIKAIRRVSWFIKAQSDDMVWE